MEWNWAQRFRMPLSTPPAAVKRAEARRLRTSTSWTLRLEKAL